MRCTASILGAPCIAIMVVAATSSAEELVLVDRGVAPAPIIVYHDAPPRTMDAAVELAAHIEKISGARPKIVTGEPDPVPERAIWVGVQPRLLKLFPKMDFSFSHPEEILIAANDSHLVIAGRDRWDPAHMEGRGRLAKITGKQQEYGTVNAVYTFLQDRLGVRWLWPDETGEDIIPQERIAISPFEYRYHPQIRARSGMLVRLSLGDNREGPDELWARRQRVQLDSLELLGGHGFTDWWDKYHVAHPDYFALQPDGTRGLYYTAENAKLCDSNPAVWAQWLVEVEQRLVADPTLRVFNVSPNDGYDGGHCVCERCRSWDRPGGELFTWRWKGVTKEWPAITDRQVTFANALARKLRQRFPERDLCVQLHAYGYSRPPPIAAVPDENVIISSVANFHLRGDGVGDDRTKSMRQFEAWAKKARRLAWRPNLGNPVGLQWGMPDIALKQAAEDFRFVADNGCVGLFFDMLWGHWATQGPYYYLISQLAWDPRRNASAVMEDYYRRGFGPASGPIRDYWTLMEETRMAFVKEVPNRHRAFHIPRRYTPDFFTRAGALLDRAESMLGDAPEKYRRRLAFVRAGLNYTRLVVDTRSWMQKVEQGGGKDAAAIARVKANWDAAADMKKTAPPFAIDWVPVFLQPTNRRMMGLHPDNPLAGRVLREASSAGNE